MHVLITRPEPDAAALRAQLEALGHQVTVEPLLKIEHLPIASDVLAGIAGLIVTSRNGLRALAASAAINAARELPLIAVGPGTAQLARELGLSAHRRGQRHRRCPRTRHRRDIDALCTAPLRIYAGRMLPSTCGGRSAAGA